MLSWKFEAFHRERRIRVYGGRSRQVAERFHVRLCFPDGATAEAFSSRFGGRCLIYAPEKPKARTS